MPALLGFGALGSDAEGQEHLPRAGIKPGPRTLKRKGRKAVRRRPKVGARGGAPEPKPGGSMLRRMAGLLVSCCTLAVCYIDLLWWVRR